MFEVYKYSQALAYGLLRNSVINNKLSHAYLFDGNDCEYSFNFVLSFVKFLFCNRRIQRKNDNCDLCNICKRIDLGNYTDLKIIDSDSSVIKKEQLLDLQSEFSKTSIEGTLRIYIIKDCDKMNKQASNCLLKFLEEPCQNVIAILLTNNIGGVLSTIVSRCQLIRLSNGSSMSNSSLNNFANFCCVSAENLESFLNDESKFNFINSVIKFIVYIEDNKYDAFIYLKEIYNDIFFDRNSCLNSISLITYFYYDVLKLKYGFENYFFPDYIGDIKKISYRNDINSIINKIDVCIDKCNLIKFNLNIKKFPYET